jgi:hypothetical protein
MRSSRIKQNNDRVLVQKESTDKNFLTKWNLLQCGEVGTTNSRRRWADRSLWLTDRWWWGPGSKTLPRLGTLTVEVPNLTIVEAWKPYPQPVAELEVEYSTAGRLEDMGPPAEVDGGSTAMMEGDQVAGLKAECRPGGT